jgi:molybdopterin/thiamine biosynthesis adenylyltransferase
VLGTAIDSKEPWMAQAEERLTPSGRRISAAVSLAIDEGCGLAFVHSHPLDMRRPELSGIDVDTSRRLGRTLTELVDAAFASIVVSPGGWSGALWDGGNLEPFDRIASVGTGLHVAGARAAPEDRLLDDRQIRAIGDAANRALRDLSIAVVGAGGIGSPVAETLARMGVGHIRLLDHDYLDTPSNTRRVFGVTRSDAERKPAMSKAGAVAAGLNRLDLGCEVSAVVGDVRDAETAGHLLDVDVIVGATDTHSSRAALAELGIRAAIPIIDCGVRVGTRRSGQLDALWLERRIQVPEGPCLWCFGTLDPERIHAELMPADQLDALEREGYITGSNGGPAPMVAGLTVTAAGLATTAILGMLGDALEGAPLAVGVDALTLSVRPFGRERPDPNCVCARWRTSS